MGSQGFHNVAGNPFVYQEDTMSAAMGLDVANQYWKLVVSASGGALPTGTSAIRVDPAGSIVLLPNVSGRVYLDSVAYPKTVAVGDVMVASFLNTMDVVSGAVTAGYVLTANGAGTAPTFQAVAGGGIGTLAGDSGTATGATVTIAGTSNQISTSATGTTVTISIPSSPSLAGTVTAATGFVSTNGSVIINNTAASAAFAELDFQKSRSGAAITSGDGLGELLFKGHDGTGFITGSQITATNSGTVATNRVASDLKFYTHPDSTTASTLRMTIASTGACTIASPDSGVGLTVSGGGITCSSGNIAASSGTLSASTTVTAGTNLVSTAGNLEIPVSTATIGQIKLGTNPFIHCFGFNNGTLNTETYVGDSCGRLAGNNTNSGYNTFLGSGAFTSRAAGAGWYDATYNVGVGAFVLNSCTTGKFNTVVGVSGRAITTGSYNTIVAAIYGGDRLITGSNNCLLGSTDTTITDHSVLLYRGAGYNYTGSESSNVCIANIGVTGESNKIRIGTQGSGIGQQNACYIAGIYGVAVGATAGVNITDSDGQVGTLSGTTGKVLMGGTKPAFSTATYPATVATGDVLVASSTNVVGVVTGAATAGYVLTANGAGTAPTFQAVTGGMLWSSDSLTTTNAAKNNGYILNKNGIQDVYLPAFGGAIGDSFSVMKPRDTGFKIQQNANQQVSFGVTPTPTIGVGHGLASSTTLTFQKLDIYLMTISGGTEYWWVTEAQGTFTIF